MATFLDKIINIFDEEKPAAPVASKKIEPEKPKPTPIEDTQERQEKLFQKLVTMEVPEQQKLLDVIHELGKVMNPGNSSSSRKPSDQSGHRRGQ